MLFGSVEDSSNKESDAFLFRALLSFSVLLLLTLIVWKQRKCWQLIWQLNGWRGVVTQPLHWLYLLFNMDPKSILDTLQFMRLHYRTPVAVLIGTRVFLYVDDPAAIEAIMTSQECLDKTFMQNGFFSKDGLLHAKGQQWKVRRKQLNPTFNHSVLASFVDIFNTVGNQTIKKFKHELQGDAVGFKDMEELLSRAVLEISCQTTMGTATNFTTQDTEEIAASYKKLMDISAIKVVKPWYQSDTVFRWLDNKNYEIGLQCNKLVKNFVSSIVQRKHAEWKQKMQSNNANKANRASSGDGDDKSSGIDGGNDAEVETAAMEDNMVGKKRIFIEQIFHLEQLGELTLQDIMNESNSMVLVSFETVSNGLMILLLCLANHLDYQQKLREEINETYPDGNIADITIMQLQQMKYLDMVVNESLRLLTTVPMNLRNVSADFKMHLPAKDDRGAITALVPKDTLVVLDIFNMQRDEAQWGPYAKKFYPEHFAESNSERHSYAFVPFSKGIRTCIGWRYSMLLTKIFIVKLISSFEFQCSGTKLEDLHFIEGISLKFQDSHKINFQIRKIH